MKWFDLSRFGAKLSVLPKSGARLHTVLRLEMPHSRLWDAEQERVAETDPSVMQTHGRFEFRRALTDLGFSEMKSRRLASPTQEVFDQHGDEYVTFVAEAVRDTIKLSELQRLMPGLSASDVVEMSPEQVMVQQDDVQGYEALWEGLRRAMVNDAVGAWAPVRSPWEQPGGKPVPIVEALMLAGLGLDSATRDRSIPASLALHADQLGYRSDALVTYYLSEADAQADGLREGEYERVGFAASVPLMVAGDGKVVALRDVWDMRDLRRVLSPREALGIELESTKGLSSIISEGLRAKQRVRTEVNEAMHALGEWVDTPRLLEGESSDRIWGELSKVGLGLELVERYPHLYRGGDGFFTVVGSKTETGGWRLNRLNTLGEAGREALALIVDRVTERSHADTRAVVDGAVKLWERMVAAETALARKSAMAAETPGTPAPEDSGRAGEDRRKHVDVGEKIGGARKDYAKRAMDAEDVALMNDAEVKLHVTKNNIWPPLDYAAMRESGMEARVAMALKVVKDSINSRPAERFARTAKASAEAYVEAVTQMRETFAYVRTEDDLKQAVEAAKDWAGEGGERLIYGDGRLIYGGARWQQLGRDLSKVLWGGVLSEANRKIERATRRWDSSQCKTVYGDPWSALVKEPKVTSDADLEERRRKNELERELHVPHLAHVQRHGEDWRQGRNVTADELLEKFGFRGIEYGEWLPQKERQEVINMAYDSFADLAQALNLRPVDMSLGGELAVAFGARGTGGRGAALAHFEPGRFVMNMTRMRGAGALAHEWFHGLDRKLGMEGNTIFATDSAVKSKTLSALVNRMEKRRPTVEELLQQSSAGAARSQSNAESWLINVPVDDRGRAKTDLHAAMGEAHGDLLQRVQDALMTQGAKHFGEAGAVPTYALANAGESVRAAMTSGWRGKLGKDSAKHIEGNIWHWAKHEGLNLTLRTMAERGMPVPDALLAHEGLARDSQYMKDAQQLDKLRSSPYWATRIEMFARAGAAYVQDKLAEQGGRCDYLVYGSEDGRKVAGIGASPNPCGDDRAALNACFDALIDEYRARAALDADREAARAAELAL